jgi:hypothetical protein
MLSVSESESKSGMHDRCGLIPILNNMHDDDDDDVTRRLDTASNSDSDLQHFQTADAPQGQSTDTDTCDMYITGHVSDGAAAESSQSQGTDTCDMHNHNTGNFDTDTTGNVLGGAADVSHEAEIPQSRGTDTCDMYNIGNFDTNSNVSGGGGGAANVPQSQCTDTGTCDIYATGKFNIDSNLGGAAVTGSHAGDSLAEDPHRAEAGTTRTVTTQSQDVNVPRGDNGVHPDFDQALQNLTCQGLSMRDGFQNLTCQDLSPSDGLQLYNHDAPGYMHANNMTNTTSTKDATFHSHLTNSSNQNISTDDMSRGHQTPRFGLRAFPRVTAAISRWYAVSVSSPWRSLRGRRVDANSTMILTDSDGRDDGALRGRRVDADSSRTMVLTDSDGRDDGTLGGRRSVDAVNTLSDA